MFLTRLTYPGRRFAGVRLTNGVDMVVPKSKPTSGTAAPKQYEWCHPRPPSTRTSSHRLLSTTTPHLHPRNESKRHKLHIGFTSLSTTLPFSSPDQTPATTPLDPRASIMLTALRGGVSALDCPAPPLLLDGSGSIGGESCWTANRQSEIGMASALEQAWMALMEEDDGEAVRALRWLGEEDGGGDGVTITCRLGYRAAVVLSQDVEASGEDAREGEGMFEGDARVGVLDGGSAVEGTAAEEEEGEWVKPPVALVHNLGKEYVMHALRTSPLVQRYKLEGSSDVAADKPKIRIVSLAHNPETQISAYLVSQRNLESSSDNNIDSLTSLQRARRHMKQCMTSAFIGYELAVKEGLIDAYGVDSNGLSLPKHHDMYFGWRDVLECAADAYLEVNGKDCDGRSSLRVIRLPGNLLETRGLDVARDICSFFGGCDASSQEEGLPSADDPNDPNVQQKRKLRQLRRILPESIDVHVTRPLTAFPYGGIGWEPTSSPGLTESSGAPPLFLERRDADGKKIDSTHPIRILDYRVESGSVGEVPHLDWTNHHYNLHGPRPSSYHGVLNAALSHFDADSILEASKERELTVEERETLDGCKLLRDMIHDLDASLDTMKSFAAYEEYLINVAVPLLYGSFEELDEESAGILQNFFAVHGMAVRMVVARWTREMILGGWKRVTSEEEGKAHVHIWDKEKEQEMAKNWESLGLGEFSGGYKVPEDETLQEFSLKHLLKDKAVRGIVVGCSRPDHVLEALRAADSTDK
ncbi:hypothetical protein HJC23_002386 [Cyclotella cryptica]|uniref:Uncharacterized protein n=1 Tax=Cyclotella cryptica TaxID=29204 RepID=A0ABD3QKW9_9STRA|eukprot:CCRYP_004490-RA/>CCRYP_004490-RA protein AED:0.06 eAED:0.06 QI:0/-1/0/1/-1/1/1/0/754